VLHAVWKLEQEGVLVVDPEVAGDEPPRQSGIDVVIERVPAAVRHLDGGRHVDEGWIGDAAKMERPPDPRPGVLRGTRLTGVVRKDLPVVSALAPEVDA